ncbi:MAG: hypothetical protein GY868_05515 [Deltaproteobacteria bacterium]|nr:hypothetical protein [Deltaproteobacteria bacterium]
MAETAEIIAQIYRLSRADQDRYTLRSYQKAMQSITNNRYAEYVVPVCHNQYTL